MIGFPNRHAAGHATGQAAGQSVGQASQIGHKHLQCHDTAAALSWAQPIKHSQTTQSRHQSIILIKNSSNQQSLPSTYQATIAELLHPLFAKGLQNLRRTILALPLCMTASLTWLAKPQAAQPTKLVWLIIINLNRFKNKSSKWH